MNNDDLKKTSDLSEENELSAADSRFDVLDQIEFDDLSKTVDQPFDDELIEGFFENKQKQTAPATTSAAVKSSAASPAKPSTSAKPAASAAKRKKDNTAYREIDARNISQSVTDFLEAGKFSLAIDKILSLDDSMRKAVKDVITVTIPLGSRDSDLRRIAAGALIQSYLDCNTIDGGDIESKLYAIIESSEPEYDEDDEIIEQTPDDVLYKVAACMTFAAELTERSGSHTKEKNAVYASDDSVLDRFLAANIETVYKTQKKRLEILADAVRESGGEVAVKFMSYYDEARKNGASLLSKFFGDSFVFKLTFGIIAALCLVSIVVYVSTRSSLLAFIATDDATMLYIIMAELFFTIGMSLLCVIIGFGGKMKALKKAEKQKQK